MKPRKKPTQPASSPSRRSTRRSPENQTPPGSSHPASTSDPAILNHPANDLLYLEARRVAFAMRDPSWQIGHPLPVIPPPSEDALPHKLSSDDLWSEFTHHLVTMLLWFVRRQPPGDVGDATLAAYAAASVAEGQPLPDGIEVFLSCKNKDFEFCVFAAQSTGVIRVWISFPNDPSGPWENFLSKDMRIYPGISGSALLLIASVLNDPSFIRGVILNKEEGGKLFASLPE